MKMNAIKIQVVLGIAMLTQVGCNGGQNRVGQSFMPYVNGTSQEHSTVGTGTQNSLNSRYGNQANAQALEAQRQRNLQLQNRNNGLGNTNRNGTDNGAGNRTTTDNTNKDKTDKTKTDTPAKDTEPTKFKVEIPEVSAAETKCTELKIDTSVSAPDQDGDGISDECEDRLAVMAKDKSEIQKDASVANYVGLNSQIFNGAVVAGRFYDNKDPSLKLTDAEAKIWKKSKVVASLGSGADSRFGRRVTKKYFALAQAAKYKDGKLNAEATVSDEIGFQGLFKLGSAITISSLKSIQARLTGDDAKNGLEVQKDKKQFALVRNDYAEMIPLSPGVTGNSAGSLSGFAKNAVESLLKTSELLYVARTNLVIPKKYVKLRVGYLTNSRTEAVAGSKAGMFMVIVGNDTQIATSDLIGNNATDADLAATEAVISNPGNCITAPLTISYVADSAKAQEAPKSMFSENVFYYDDEDSVWKPLPQEWMRVRPLSKNGSDCYVDESSVVFKDLKKELSTDPDRTNSTSLITPKGTPAKTLSATEIDQKIEKLATLIGGNDLEPNEEVAKLNDELEEQTLTEAQKKSLMTFDAKLLVS